MPARENEPPGAFALSERFLEALKREAAGIQYGTLEIAFKAGKPVKMRVSAEKLWREEANE